MTEQDALNEFRRQLVHGNHVWIDNWRTRFGHLAASPKDLLKKHPDEFALTFTGPNKFTVTLLRRKPTPPATPPWRRMGPTAIKPSVSARVVPPRYPGLVGKGQGKGAYAAALPAVPVPKGRGKGPSMVALPVAEGTEEDAVREIRRQLKDRGDGKVWIDDWHRRFKAQAKSPREFMEARPDLFLMTIDGNKFTSEWIGDDDVWGEVEAEVSKEEPVVEEGNGWKKRKWSAGSEELIRPLKMAKAEEGTEDDAMDEIVQQLSDPKNTQNKVWITGWGRRYAHLGSLRDFLESHPERFSVIPGHGRSYTVTLLEE
mmetsp:Transcript_85352/g.198448  ORF Transcript_85352/g.198448 Transcript_85352/m.198448 type:complete len:314 (+) Transcript_85352:69-1010(+)|eukprot:CAMPEP_0171109922 /NCGR_PEP_ID=MMETSP0766_2-20121228/71060_1 /TAXON_ID=439317 /ORGANISM="Gambierdiscus australes, Strain CAWD 149" /LENGTH=313 /DNA_ID=CAMNT_0011571727 /DNA_START=64 /DNA_END=1005 /DNA_ORIENTATION=-